MSCTALVLALTLSSQGPDDTAQVRVGDVVQPFNMTDIRFLPRGLDEVSGEKATVLVFTTLECPIARRYLPRVIELEQEFHDAGVALALVNAGAGDSMLAVSTDMVERGIEFPVLKDFDGSAVQALGITRTPEAAVLDGEGRLLYRGRIDDQYRLGGARPASTRADLREAIVDVLAGRPVREPQTPVDGCKLTAPQVAGDEDLTWSEDVAPILYAHCVECHRPDGPAPFSLLGASAATRRAQMIDEVVAQRRMPPWFASEAHGQLSNRRGLSEEELGTIRAWVAAGAATGDRSRAPEPPTFGSGEWAAGTPDLVVSQVGAESLPADGYIPYRYVLLQHVFLRDTWVSSVEIRCDNEPALHHANLAFVKLGEQYRADNFITGKVPGGDPMVLEPGLAVLIPAGSILGLQAHFVTTGEPETARLSVGLRFPKEPVRRRLYHRQIRNLRFEIPPHARAHEVRASWTPKQDITGLGMFSHMHLRGRDMTFTSVSSDGARETLLMVPNYSFDWQQSYRFTGAGRDFPAGTRIEVVAHFDNSKFNPYNPDPTAAVRFGLQTYHEMMYGFFFYYRSGEALDIEVDPETGFVNGS